MRIVFCSVVAALLAVPFAPHKALAQESSACLYNDEHFHIQDF
jgi:hypothetical protein